MKCYTNIVRPRPGLRPRAGQRPFKPGDVAAAYGWPKLPAPAANPVAPLLCYIELGGGYQTSDFSAAASAGGYPVPVVNAYGVNGAANSPGGDADGEVALDGQVGAAVFSHMTGLPARVAMIFAPNDGGASFAAAITGAVELIQKNGGLGTISISWGGPEDSWPASDVQKMEAALSAAQTAGIPVCAASGDSGSSDGEAGNHCDYPASSAYVVGCGGTWLTANGDGSVTQGAWNAGGGAGGGGVSALFGLPGFQKGFAPSGLVGRCVPDVAADADPNTGYLVYLGGQAQPIGGTSAVAPLVAAFLAAVQWATQKPLPALPAALYPLEPDFFDVVAGNNGAFSATKGYDLATGLGSPMGSLAAALPAGAPVGQPPTAPTPPPPTTAVTAEQVWASQLPAWQALVGDWRFVRPIAADVQARAAQAKKALTQILP